MAMISYNKVLGGEEVSTYFNDIRPKVNVTVWQEFALANLDAAV